MTEEVGWVQKLGDVVPVVVLGLVLAFVVWWSQQDSGGDDDDRWGMA